MREFIRENAAAIGGELYAAYWWCRCKTAATVALTAVALGSYCQWRGQKAFIAFWFARRLVALAVLLMPVPLRPLAAHVAGE